MLLSKGPRFHVIWWEAGLIALVWLVVWLDDCFVRLCFAKGAVLAPQLPPKLVS